MDERELTAHLIDVVDQVAYRNAAHHVMAVRIAIGGRRHFDLDRLASTFTDAARGTVADGARLHVEVLPVRRRCRSCHNEFDAAELDCPCPVCRHPHTEALSGEEMRILDIQVD